MRLAFILLVVSLSGCGSCVDEGSEGQPTPTASPPGRPAGTSNRVLQRAARTGLQGTLTIQDAGVGDE